jgi:hypothetical protein
MFMRRRPWRLASAMGVRADATCNGCGKWTYPLVDEHSNDQAEDEENNDEDDDDTGFALGPVLVALG